MKPKDWYTVVHSSNSPHGLQGQVAWLKQTCVHWPSNNRRRQEDRETGRQRGREAMRPGIWETVRAGGKESGRQGGREAGETGRQGGRETERQGVMKAGRNEDEDSRHGPNRCQPKKQGDMPVQRWYRSQS